jgi:hypothetical protein
MNTYLENSCITEHGVIYERVITQKILCEFYKPKDEFDHGNIHICRLKSIEPDTDTNYRYTCSCDKKWKLCDIKWKLKKLF